jgi:hypothetical protein
MYAESCLVILNQKRVLKDVLKVLNRGKMNLVKFSHWLDFRNIGTIVFYEDTGIKETED